MRLTRHARNRLRRLDLTVADVESIVSAPCRTDVDADGRRRYIGVIAGRRLRVVVAVDDPELVVTVHRRRS